MKKLSLFLTVLAVISTAQAAEITCTTKAFASCKNQDSCFDFYEGPGVDLDMLEGVCNSMEGEFSEAACDRTGAVLSCLNAGNFLMPMTHFFGEMDREEAADMCTAMGGKVCP